MEDDDFFGEPGAVPTSRLGRLWKTGRSAVGLAGTMLGRRDVAARLGSVEALTRRLGELRGLGMKVGQILSFIDPSLPPETRAALARLQRQAPASPPEAVRETIKGAFPGRAAALLEVLSAEPVAVASIAQVHRATLPGVGEVAVKVLHPGIERAIDVDFSTALGGVNFANALLLGAASQGREFLDEARDALRAECDLASEATFQRAFAAWLKDDPVLVVPEVIDAWSARSVLTTRWQPGLGLEALLATGPDQATRDGFGAALFRASVGGFYRLGLLHADPHPGNFAFRDGRVVLYDFGCVRRFGPEATEAFWALGQALRAHDTPAMERAAHAFGFRFEGAERRGHFERFARSFFAPMLTDGPSVIPPEGQFETAALLRDKRVMAKLGLPARLLFLLRLRFGLYAVLSRLGARCDWARLEAAAHADPSDPGAHGLAGSR